MLYISIYDGHTGVNQPSIECICGATACVNRILLFLRIKMKEMQYGKHAVLEPFIFAHPT